MPIPNKDLDFPIRHSKEVVFLKNIIKSPNIIVGDYTYYSSLGDPAEFEKCNVLYHYKDLGDRLIIGKFSSISAESRFIMNGANRRLLGISTYPFNRFGGDWSEGAPSEEQLSFKGDTIIGNDVWVGYKAVILPGIKVGSGAIIAADAVVTKDVPAYSIVGGNPAKVIRKRFSDGDIEILLRITWLNLDVKYITEALPLITKGDVKALLSFAEERVLVQ